MTTTSGEGPPGELAGAPGDFYLDELDGTLYLFSGASTVVGGITWTALENRRWTLGDPDSPQIIFGGRDSLGVEWYCEEPDGWHSTAKTERGLDDKPGAGAWLGPGRFTERVLEFRGMVRACTSDLLEGARERLIDALTPLSADVTVAVTEPTPKQVTARVAGKILCEPVFGNRRARPLSFNLVAGDPLKYAAGLAGLRLYELRLQNPANSPGMEHPLEHPVDFGGPAAGLPDRVVAVNGGTADALPIVTLIGPCPAPAAVNVTAGEQFRLRGALAEGDTAVVDMHARTVHVNGISAYDRRDAGSTFWAIRPGPNDIRFFADAYDPAAAMTVQFRTAWKG